MYSISYVSDKLQVSRPSLYKYMDLYNAGEYAKIPFKVFCFFDHLSSSTKTEDNAILYFIKARNENKADGLS